MTSVASASRVTDDRKTVLLFAPEHTDLFLGTTQCVCFIPQSRNTSFVVRGGIFEQIDEGLARAHPSQQVRKSAICGLGGVG